MKNLRPIKGKFYIARLVAEGEHEHQDFKFAISDARKIARSISAFANNDGGRLLVGIKDNGTVAGVRNEEDIFVIEQAASTYCDPPQEIEVTAFNAGDGMVVFRVTIARAPERPVRVKEEGRRLQAYYRVADENIAVPQLLERAWRERDCGSAAERSFALCGPEQQLLLMLQQDDCEVTLKQFVTTAHVSMATGEDCVVRLYGLGLIDLAYCGDGFRIKAADDSDDEVR